jgi:hypothetical protein
MLVALAIRLWGIDYALPYLYHPDEPDYAATAQRIFKTGDLNPHVFNYPSVFYYLNAAAYVPFYLGGKLLGVVHSRADLAAPQKFTLGIAYTDMPETILLGRWLTVAFGVGTVVLVFLIGRKLFQSDIVGLLAALITAISGANVFNSRAITPDTYVTFFVMLAFWGAVLVFREGKTWHYIFAGVAAGLAASSKYNGAIILLALIAAHLLRNEFKGLKDWRIYTALALSGLAFFAGTPFALLDFQSFFVGFESEALHYSTGHLGMEGDTFNFYMTQLLSGDGPIAILAALEVVRGILVRSKAVILLSVFPVVYLLFISQFIVRNDRTLLPLTPFVYLLGASFLLSLLTLKDRLQPVARKVLVAAMAGVVLICVAYPLQTMLVGTTQRISEAQNRETARMWVNQNVPLGARIVIEAYSVLPDTKRFAIAVTNSLIERTPEQYTTEGFDYLISSQHQAGRFFKELHNYPTEVARYQALFHAFQLVQTFPHPDYGIQIYRVKKQ